MGIPWTLSGSSKPTTVGCHAPPLPLHTLQSWSPKPDDPSIRLFHDGPEHTAQLTTARAAEGSSSFALDATNGALSFASLAIEIPSIWRASLDTTHILRLDADLHAPSYPTVYARLNLRHGPDTDAIPRAIPYANGPCFAEFDLATTLIGARPLQHLWMDLIFERPGVTQIIVSDLTLSVRPRAQF